MWNPFIIVWNALNPHPQDEMENIPGEENIRKYTSSILSLIFVTLLLIVTIDLYIDIQEVPNLETSIEGKYIVHNWKNNLYADVNVIYDYSKSNDISNEKAGISIAYTDSSVPYFYNTEVQRSFKGKINENGEQFYKTSDGFQLITWNHPIVHFPISEEDSLLVDSLIKAFNKDYPDENYKTESINSIVNFRIKSGFPLRFWDLFRDDSPFAYIIHGYKPYDTYYAFDELPETKHTIENPSSESFIYAKTTPDNERLFITRDVLRFSKEMGGKTRYRVKSTSTMHKSCASVWVTHDISRAIISYKCNGALNMNSLRINFIGATDFSVMNPIPDSCDYNSIVFTDSVKLSQIKSNGIIFHTKFPDMENLQQTRNFVITLILSLLISLFFKSLYDIFRYKIKSFYIGKRIVSLTIVYILIALSIIITILFIGRPWHI